MMTKTITMMLMPVNMLFMVEDSFTPSAKVTAQAQRREHRLTRMPEQVIIFIIHIIIPFLNKAQSKYVNKMVIIEK